MHWDEETVLWLPEMATRVPNMRTKQVSWDAGTCSAASYGHLEWLNMTKTVVLGMRVLYMAALNGHLECLKYAHENGCRWNGLTCAEAARNGHLEV